MLGTELLLEALLRIPDKMTRKVLANVFTFTSVSRLVPGVIVELLVVFSSCLKAFDKSLMSNSTEETKFLKLLLPGNVLSDLPCWFAVSFFNSLEVLISE